MRSISNIFLLLLLVLTACNNDEINDLNDQVNGLHDSINVINQNHDAYVDSLSMIIHAQEAYNDSLNMLKEQLKKYDSVDIKAAKMEHIGHLFESMARQPEASESLISATTVLYEDFQDLLPISDTMLFERGRARGMAFGKMFEAVARQPEAAAMIDSAAEKFLGLYDPAIINNEILEYSQTYAYPKMVEGLCRQPEADSIFKSLANKYLHHNR
jgi:F0F1-type ATP synthase membrane subunit c/vacuolar-type H+-ATPase subunit K